MIVPGLSTGSLAGEFKIGGLGAGTPAAVGPQALSGALAGAGTASGSGGFGDALSKAIGSLEATQASAAQSSEQLATGQLSDPTQAITAVENASLTMDFASQIRNQLDAAATQIFQTQL